MVYIGEGPRAGHRAGTTNLSDINSDMEITIPTHFQCPISLDLMKDPVTLSTGITYDRESIEKWIKAGHMTCPVTKQVLKTCDQIPNHALRKIIQDWCVENQYEVSELCSKIMSSISKYGDEKMCEEIVGKIKAWAKGSEHNKRCVIENGTGFVLSSLFESFADVSIEEHACLLMEILSTLTWMFPLGVEAQSKLGSSISLRCMAWFLKGEDLSSRRIAVLALEKLLSSDQRHVHALAEIEGVAEALFKIIKRVSSIHETPTIAGSGESQIITEFICRKATKASLMAIYHMTMNEKMTRRFVEIGLVSWILELLVDAERGICEKALGVLEGICECDEGREVALNHALTMPVLVKKILRESDTVTEFSVSVLWKLCRDENEGVVVEAVELGAFQKLLVVLQVGCGERTKERATELLKLLNRCKDRLDCFEYSSKKFQYLKRPY